MYCVLAIRMFRRKITAKHFKSFKNELSQEHTYIQKKLWE